MADKTTEVKFCAECATILEDDLSGYEEGCPNCGRNVELEDGHIIGLFTKDDAVKLYENVVSP